MPELPDVEVFRRYLENTALDQPIEKLEVLAEDVVEGVSVEHLRSRAEGRRFRSTDRHGKYLFAELDNRDWLVFHFGMTGYLAYFKEETDKPGHTRALFHFAGGYRLAFVLQRKLGMITLTEDTESFVKGQGLGVDALDKSFGLDDFKRLLRGAKSGIKSALTNQSHIAGIGNIYADEILFQARVNPKALVGRLTDQDLERVFQAMKEVLETAIECQADPTRMPEHYLLPQREEGGTCPRCQSEIKRTRVSGRGGYFCPRCQPG